jgi:8-oxo-dGTP pyrophosphatase MutT (NUDIX family)
MKGVLVVLTVGDDVWLAQRTALDRAFLGYHASPGGSIELGETPAVAGLREVVEETQLELDRDRLVFLGVSMHQYDDGRPFEMRGFTVELTEDEVPICTEPHKQGPWARWSIHELPTPLTPGTAAMIKSLRNERGGSNDVERP